MRRGGGVGGVRDGGGNECYMLQGEWRRRFLVRGGVVYYGGDWRAYVGRNNG